MVPVYEYDLFTPRLQDDCKLGSLVYELEELGPDDM
jgi:hypothetical protein